MHGCFLGNIHTLRPTFNNLCESSPIDQQSNKLPKITSHPLTEMMKQQESQGIEAFAKMPVAVILPILLYYGYDLCDFTLKHDNVRALYDRKYDLVIVEIFGTDSMIGLGQQFDAPVIGFSTFSTSRWTNDLIGNPSPLSYISHTMQDFPDKMNLWNRIYNIAFYGYESLILNAMSHPLQVN